MVTNQHELQGRLTQDNNDGTIELPGDTEAPSGVVDAEDSSDVPEFPSGCGILGIEVGELSGSISGDGPPSAATLITDTFEVPATSSCGDFDAAVNNFLGLPATGMARFELKVDWL